MNKIVDERKQPVTIFDNLDVGQCFMYGNMLCMVLDSDIDGGNVVSLSDGVVLYVAHLEDVTPVSVEILIQ